MADNTGSTSGLKYVKMPRNVTEYTLMKGVTDFSNLKQFDLFETGYSFLTVVSTPRFMTMLANKDANIANLQNGLVHIMEGEFKGLSGIPDITGDVGEISNGANNIELINNVTMATSNDISMQFYERSGGLIAKYLSTYLTGIKDPYSKAKTYHGLIGQGAVTDPGPDYEVFTFLYYVTDNTMRKIEKAYLLANAQPTNLGMGDLYTGTRGSYEFKEMDLSFKCFVIMGDQINLFANMMLHNDLNSTENARKLILDSNDYTFDAFKTKVGYADGTPQTNFLDGSGLIAKYLTSANATTVQSRTANGVPLGDQTSS